MLFELSFSVFKVFYLYFFFSNTGGFFLKFPLFPWANYLVVVHLATAILYNRCYIDMSLLCIIPSCYFWQNLRTGTTITFWLILTFELGINFQLKGSVNMGRYQVGTIIAFILVCHFKCALNKTCYFLCSGIQLFQVFNIADVGMIHSGYL